MRSSDLLEKILEFSVPEPNSGCWLWIGSYQSGGLKYGRVACMGKWKKAHRVSWEIFRGDIPYGGHILHKCDVPICINPDHLFIGDQATNNKDMYAKGRSYDRRGHANPRSKLTPEQVSEIRSLPRKDQDMLGKQYGVSQSSISRIQRGEVY